MKKIVISTLITLVLLLGLSTAVFAQTGEPVVVNVVTGTVVEVSQLNGTVTVEVDGEAVVFAAPEGFDFTGVRTGDEVEVETTTDDNGVTTVVSISVVVEETPTPTETATPDGTVTPTEEPEAPVCGPTHKQHPVGARIAATYGLEYETVIGWHCEGYGFGQIMLALQTSTITELPAEDLLQMKTEQGGWGRVWQGLGLIGRAKEAEAPTEPVEEEPTAVVPTDGETVEPSETPTLEEGEGTEEATVLNDQAGKEKKSKDKDKGKNADPVGVDVETVVAPDETDQPVLIGNADQNDKGNNGKSDKNDKGNNGKSNQNNKGNSGNAGKGPGRK